MEDKNESEVTDYVISKYTYTSESISVYAYKYIIRFALF